jgi:hypothetical protein
MLPVGSLGHYHPSAPVPKYRRQKIRYRDANNEKAKGETKVRGHD